MVLLHQLQLSHIQTKVASAAVIVISQTYLVVIYRYSGIWCLNRSSHKQSWADNLIRTTPRHLAELFQRRLILFWRHKSANPDISRLSRRLTREMLLYPQTLLCWINRLPCLHFQGFNHYKCIFWLINYDCRFLRAGPHGQFRLLQGLLKCWWWTHLICSYRPL